MPTFSVTIAKTEADFAQGQQLFQAYAESLDFNLCFQNFGAEMKQLPQMYGSPKGVLLLAKHEQQAIGCVGLRQLADNIGEMKRLYVLPDYQSYGLGRRLTIAIIDQARRLGYQAIRLDSLPSMQQALKLYRSLGFQEIPPYCFNPIPGAVYLELNLA